MNLVIRHACVRDSAALEHLAALDSSSRLGGDVLLAEVDGALVAALSLRDGAHIADPFHSTADLVELLRLRAAQNGEHVRERARFARLRSRFAF